MHKQRGYILFLLFSVLSVCSILITLFFTHSMTYRQLMNMLVTEEKAKRLALGSTALGQSLLYVAPETKDSKEPDKKEQAQTKDPDQTRLTQIFPFLFTPKEFILKEKHDGIDAKIELMISSESGKLNINSLYDFAEKKFINEGKQNDRKKFCQWLFKAISKKTNQPDLFNVFEKYLKERACDLNDPTELLQTKEFATTFENKSFYTPTKNSDTNIYLTDLFTTSTQQDTINPWFLSHSWQVLLNLHKPKNLSSEEEKKILQNYKKEIKWEHDWDLSMKLLYGKEYKDLPQEIKSMLTTNFEATIFSLLQRAMIGETMITIFTILKSNTKDPSCFDIVKVYQI